MYKDPDPEAGFLKTYAIMNNFTSFRNATLRIYYNDVVVTNENYLKLYKCDDWNFTYSNCTGTWRDVTSNSSINSDDNYMKYVTQNFSIRNYANSTFYFIY